MIEDQYWGAVRNREGKLMLTVMPMFETIGAVFDLRIVRFRSRRLHRL
jgi:hypothetical protein